MPDKQQVPTSHRRRTLPNYTTTAYIRFFQHQPALMGIPGDGLNDLPSELVCNIFRLTIGQADDKADRCRLMLVCRQWRKYVEGSALLWTGIAARHGPTYVRRALEKSRGAMIDIYCQISRRPAMELETFLIEAGPHIARWRSLRLGVPRSTPPLEIALAPLTTAQAPSLEFLSLSIRSAYLESKNPITLFGGAPAPSPLRDLSVLRIPVAFEPLGLSGLVSLNLELVPTISTPELLEILRGSPGLEILSLEDNTGLVAIESRASNIQPIELRKLVSLSLRWVDNGGANCILSNIRIPNRRRVSIAADIRGVGARSVLLTPSITHLLRKTIPVSDVSSSATIMEEIYGREFYIQIGGIELKLFVEGVDHIREILGWLADGLGLEAAECPVHLILDWSEIDLVRLAGLPPPFVIKHLSISDYTTRSLREALYMAMAQAPDPTSSGWLLPQLESLRVGFKTMESQTQLVSMLRGRYEEATPTGGTKSKCPVNLRSVELRGQPRTRSLVEKIKGILREANIFWGDEWTNPVE